MSRIRDIANLFSANTAAATDSEVTTAISAHNSSTTTVHGISDTADLATSTSVASAVSTHNTTANGHVKRGNTASRPASPSNGDVYANTETGYFEHYDGTSWSAVGAPASTPSSVVATNQGSGRAYNSGQASVAFSAGTITGSTYTVTSSPGSYTSSGASSPLVVTGLQSSTQYTYTVIAANKFGTSSASSASSGVTATTVPQAPTIDSVTAGSEEVSVAFTAGATGGSAITGYTVTSSPGSLTASGASSPLVVTGLTNGTAYTFTAVATNANGTSSASTASSSVTPAVLGEYESIATLTPSNSGQMNFTSIPSTYKHLQIRLFVTDNPIGDQMIMQLGSSNSIDTTASNYNFHVLGTQGSAVTSLSLSNSGGVKFAYGGNGPQGSSPTSNVFAVYIIDILDYTNTNKYKTVRSLGGYNTNSTYNVIDFVSGAWRSFNAINCIRFSTNNFGTVGTVALYGIKG